MTAADQLTDKFLEVINQIQAQVVSHAGEGINFMLVNTQINAAQELCYGFVAIGIGILAFKLFKKSWNKFKVATSESGYGNELPYIIGCVGCAVLLVICSVGSLQTIFNVWEWISIFDPKVALAHQIMEHFLK